MTPPARRKQPTKRIVASVAMNIEPIAAMPTMMSAAPTISINNEFWRKVSSSLLGKSVGSEEGDVGIVFLVAEFT